MHGKPKVPKSEHVNGNPFRLDVPQGADRLIVIYEILDETAYKGFYMYMTEMSFHHQLCISKHKTQGQAYDCLSVFILFNPRNIYPKSFRRL